jgi:hypothetical protein
MNLKRIPEYHIIYSRDAFFEEFCAILDAYRPTSSPPVLFHFFSLNVDGSTHHEEYRFHAPTFVLRLIIPFNPSKPKETDEIKEYLQAKAIVCHQHLQGDDGFDDIPFD